MLSKLILYLKPESFIKFTVNYGSLFHGVLMEKIDPEYADILHMSQLNPYTQHIEPWTEGGIRWIITALTDEAKEKIINLLENAKEIFLKDKNMLLKIVKYDCKTDSYDELIKNTYFNKAERIFQIKFITPTAFKSDGQYVFFPDIRLIYKSLMNKFDTFSENNSIKDDDVLEHLFNNSKIIKYNLKSLKFSLEGITIPSFVGYVSIKVSGPESLVGLANLLAKYSEYSGIGIKTALGMGACEYSIREKRGEIHE